MCDTPVATPIAELIRDAYLIAGQSKDQKISGQDVVAGVRWLNSHLAQMSGDNKTIFYISTLEFEPDGTTGDFKIGTTSVADISANPFNDIINLSYNVGELTYTAEYMPPKSFESITFKEFTTYPQYYTFEVQKDYTLLRIWPRPLEGSVVKIRGKQKLSSVTLFQETDEFPTETLIYLTHAIAPYLLPRTGGVLYSRYEQTFAEAKQTLFASTKQDVQEELVPPMFSGLMGRRWGGFTNGSGGWYG